MIKLKNILAENMRRFKTKNLNEDESSSYKVSQEQARLKNIADKLVTKFRAMSDREIDLFSDEDSVPDVINYTIKLKRKVESGKGRNYRLNFEIPKIVLSINPSKDDAGEYVNVDTGKLYVDIYPNSNNRGGNGMGGVYHKSHVLDAGIGMFGKSEDSLVDEIIKLASDTFIL